MKAYHFVILSAVLLSVFSLTMLSSIAPSRTLIQFVFLLMALLSGWLVWSVGFLNWRHGATAIFLAAAALLIATMVFGSVTRGSTRWLAIGNTRLQSSELAKPALLLFSTTLLANPWPSAKKKQLLRLGRYFLYTLPVVGLVLVQPDLGTAGTLAVILAAALYFSGVPAWIVVCASVAIALLIPGGKFFLAEYQLERVESFLNPYADPRGSGYQVIQSTIAVGSGMWTGRGLGQGTQSRLKFLPERHTDFMFASLAEELGMVGAFLVILLYAVLIGSLAVMAMRSTGRAAFLFLSGAAVWLFFQTVVNIGMNIGLLPVTGIPLPLLSSGGSSVISSGITLGMAISAGRSAGRV